METKEINSIMNECLTDSEKKVLINKLFNILNKNFINASIPIAVQMYYKAKNGNNQQNGDSELYWDYKFTVQILMDIIIYIKMAGLPITLNSIINNHYKNVKKRQFRDTDYNPVVLSFDGEKINILMFSGLMSFSIPFIPSNAKPQSEDDEKQPETTECTPSVHVSARVSPEFGKQD